MQDILNISVNQSITIKNNSTTIQTLTTILLQGKLTLYIFLGVLILYTDIVCFDTDNIRTTCCYLLLSSCCCPPPPSNLTYGSLSDSMSSLGSLVSLSSSDASVLLDSSVSPVSLVSPVLPVLPVLSVPSILPFICTSEGTPLSTRTNWIFPIGSYKEPCHLCEYYEHGLKMCPNLHPDYISKCCRCWSTQQGSRECRINRNCIRRPISFKNNFLKPAELLKFYGRIEE